MRTGKPSIERYDAKRRNSDKTSTAWRVRWRVYDTPGERGVDRKQGGFLTKGAAAVFIENLQHGDLRRDGWTLDARGFPVPPAKPAEGECVLGALEIYSKQRWTTDWKSAKTKEKNRGRLLVVAAALLKDPHDSATVLSALAADHGGRARRREPSTAAQRAARYLRDVALDPGQPSDDQLDPKLAAGQAWLMERSLCLDELDDAQLQRVRDALLPGRRAGTQITYWATVKAFLRWLVESKRIGSDPAAGLPKIRRDIPAEQVDPERVPSTSEIWQLANAAAPRFGLSVAALIVVLFFAALRIGEAAGLRRKHIAFTASGQAWLTVRTQHDRVTARYSDEGTTQREGAPKGRSSGPGARRRVPIPRAAATVLRRHLDENVGPSPSARVFTQPRGGPLSADTFRASRWNPLIEQVFGADHPVAAMTPHDCRHGGMTRWLRLRLYSKTIQRYGGWSSLKVMLDTYAGVLPDDDDRALDAIEDEDGQDAAA